MRTASVLLSLALILATGLVYGPSLSGEFVYDDLRFVSLNKAVAEGTSLHRYFLDPGTQSADASYGGLYRPLRTLSFRFGRLLGEGASAQRGVSLALHLLNGLLVWLLLRQLLGRVAALPPLVGALTFLLHPLATESVAWVSSRGDVLFSSGLLLAVLCYRRKGLLPRAASLVFFLLALLSKETAAVLPLVLVLLDGYEGGLARIRSRLLVYVPFVAVLIAYLGLRFLVLGGDAFAQERGLGLDRLSLVSSILVGGVYYGYVMLIPAGLSFELRIPTGPDAPGLAVAGLFLFAALLVLAVVIRRRAPTVTLAILWLLVTLLPVTALQLLFPMKILVANRFAYPALVAAGLLLAWVSSRGRAFAWLSVSVLAAFVPLTLARAEVWQSPKHLWTDVLERDPSNPVALYALGRDAMRREEWGSAQDLLRKAAEADRFEPKLAFFLAEVSDRLAAASPAGSRERAVNSKRALDTYHAAIRLWEGGNSQGVVLYRAALLHAAWLAGKLGREDLVVPYVTSFIETEGKTWTWRRPGVLRARVRDLVAHLFGRSEDGLAADLAAGAADLPAGGGR